MCGASFCKCKKIPKQEVKSIFNGQHIIDTVLIDSSDESVSEANSETDSEPKQWLLEC